MATQVVHSTCCCHWRGPRGHARSQSGLAVNTYRSGKSEWAASWGGSTSDKRQRWACTVGGHNRLKRNQGCQVSQPHWAWCICPRRPRIQGYLSSSAQPALLVCNTSQARAARAFAISCLKSHRTRTREVMINVCGRNG